jgi:hypothetical protein
MWIKGYKKNAVLDVEMMDREGWDRHEDTHNRKSTPRSVKWAIVLGFFGTLAASFLVKGISASVKPGTRSGPKSGAVRVSPQ